MTIDMRSKTIACRNAADRVVVLQSGPVCAAEPANATPLTYRVPLAGDLPERYESFVLELGGPGPFGAKGIGESGMLGVAAAIANAIEDAVGVRLTQIPFTPERVLAAIEAAR
jgi:CO/xanthine dehydrogenase Mo-binding subunit